MPNKSFQKEIELTDNQSLVIKNLNGPIELIACQGNTLHIEAKISSDNQKVVDETDVVVEQTPDQVTIRVEPTGSKRFWGWKSEKKSARVEFFIKAPQWVPLSAKNLNGDIKSWGFDHLSELKTMNGGLEIEGCSGNPILKAMNGQVVTHSCSFGGLEAKTMNGPIAVETTISPQGDYHLKSMQGEIKFLIPQGTNASIEAKSLHGEIDCQLPLKGLQRGRNKLKGILGEGGARVGLKGMNGRITLAQLADSDNSGSETELIARMLKEGRITQDEASKLREAIYG